MVARGHLQDVMMEPVIYSRLSYAIVFYASVALVYGSDILREIREQDSPSDAIQRDQGSKRLLSTAMGISGFLSFWVPYVVPAATISWNRPLVFGVGIVMMLGGYGFRWYAIRTLGQYFTGSVMIQRDQTIIEEGPYQLIRHPSYTGGIIMYVGIGVALTNWVSIGLLLVIALVVYGYRMRVEERALREELGESYTEYMGRTPYRLVPFLW